MTTRKDDKPGIEKALQNLMADVAAIREATVEDDEVSEVILDIPEDIPKEVVSQRPDSGKSPLPDSRPERFVPPERMFASDEELLGSFPEQYCRDCDIATGRFYGAMRRALGSKRRLAGGDVKLDSDDIERVKRGVAPYIEHLDTCPATEDPEVLPDWSEVLQRTFIFVPANRNRKTRN